MDRCEALETFVRVVEAGSFSGAAERLMIAKSAVSRRITDLEERLGSRLLNRTTRRLSLTEAGQQLYERAVRLLADLEEVERSFTDEGELRGQIRMAAPLSFGLMHLTPVVSEFLERHPQVTFDLDLNDRQVNLVEEGFDLTLRIATLEESSLVARRLAPIRLVACASPAYLARHGTPRHPEELAHHAGLHYANAPDGTTWSFIGPDGRRHEVKVPLRLRANNGDLQVLMARQGLGITVAPTFLLYRHLASGELLPILPDYQLPTTAAWAVYPSHRHLPRRVRQLIDLMVLRFGDEPYWDRGPLAG